MSSALISLPYFGAINGFVNLVNYNKIIIEQQENFQKQTYRNRQYIYGANGKLMLNIPVKHSKSSIRKKYNDCMIENSFNWQEIHFKSLETAYRTSPYFEFYEDEILPLFTESYEKLFDYNLACFKKVLDLLNVEIELDYTTTYMAQPTEDDLRHLILAKNEDIKPLEPYHQVFENKHGFIENLSILDLIFNMGPQSLSYLKAQHES